VGNTGNEREQRRVTEARWQETMRRLKADAPPDFNPD
jgi:hypothetical protein